jgi:hypothetical protein
MFLIEIKQNRSFDLSNLCQTEATCQIKKIILNLQSECFESGRVTWTINWSNNEDERVILDKENVSDSKSKCPFKSTAIGSGQWELNEIANEELVRFKIRADLSGGTGQNAWQHTQLFRQHLNDNKSLFSVSFQF